MKNFEEIAALSQFEFPDVSKLDEEVQDLVSLGADLEIPTLLNAYSSGFFPMHVDSTDVDGMNNKIIGWFSPQQRAIFTPNSLHVTRSMKQSFKKYECRVDTCFVETMRMCMTVSRPHGWIDDEFIERYTDLHNQGFAHSIEIFSKSELVGGLYGVGFAGFFAGESMFHTKRDASKVALMYLMEIAHKMGITLIDAQWMTDHLESLGAIVVTRTQYHKLLRESLKVEPRQTWQQYHE